MTPTPASGDIWEWIGDDPAIVLLIRKESTAVDDYWVALNLTIGTVEDISINHSNSDRWKRLA